MTELRNFNLRLAAMLLIDSGRISVDEIRALPLVESRAEAINIAQKIYDVFSERYDVTMEGECIVLSSPEIRSEAAGMRSDPVLAR